MSSVDSTQKTLIRLAASEEELHFHFATPTALLMKINRNIIRRQFSQIRISAKQSKQIKAKVISRKCISPFRCTANQILQETEIHAAAAEESPIIVLPRKSIRLQQGGNGIQNP